MSELSWLLVLRIQYARDGEPTSRRHVCSPVGNECKVPRAVETGPRSTELRGQEDNRNIFTMRPVHERRLGGGVRPKPHLVSHGSSHRTSVFGAIFSWTKTTKRRRMDACEKLIHMKNDVRNKSPSWFGALRRATAVPTMHEMRFRGGKLSDNVVWGTGGGGGGRGEGERRVVVRWCALGRAGPLTRSTLFPRSQTVFHSGQSPSTVDAAVDVWCRPQHSTRVSFLLPAKSKVWRCLTSFDQLTWNRQEFGLVGFWVARERSFNWLVGFRFGRGYSRADKRPTTLVIGRACHRKGPFLGLA